ncbi:type I-U CRISPR-associated RAMP protein Csb1/Cas7u [Coraliomargarita sp. SDUM461004]|uniref:Type I-U CRISPR-associated RAMP protein Csb1/Cas7u n=1 Tax=Thalassobacterium sedimentorum TaxID=3041258 RepID=A0ABU1ANL8_9BACT|nr:type I-U CRISPR-associated RAMP protein Csb1/Cas7u [Coraliomargarita sp. SDUM461004]MDQ8195798.1 type I-U CRISPR-associated RAMP protein Csb1/Cas7u [Coraliomargarita sp. SDUM461004]
MKNIDLALIQNAIKGPAAAFRCRTHLQPAGGEGDKTFPPTYAGAVYATEHRRVKQADGSFETIPCILLDSVQSQANRMELALQQAIDNGRFKECPIPLISVSFAGEDLLNEIGTITSFEAPHRAADAILRDSLHEGVPFRKSEIGKKLDFVSLQNATPLYEICPTALIFGIWDSTGPKGGLGAKFQRALVSEIVGINAINGTKTSSRIDPLEIRAAAKVLKSKDGYQLAESEKDKSAVSPSEVNHGNIPPSIDDQTGGVTIDYAEQTIVLSLPALRRLKFPDADGKTSPERDAAGQTVLATLAIVAVSLAAENGYDLRSRCLLWPDEQPNLKLLEKPGVEPAALSIESDAAIQALTEAVATAEKLGLTWRKEPLNLTPAPQLVALLKKSQEIASAEAITEEA